MSAQTLETVSINCTDCMPNRYRETLFDFIDEYLRDNYPDYDGESFSFSIEVCYGSDTK